MYLTGGFMQSLNNTRKSNGYVFRFTHEKSLQDISNELLICIATVGLMAVVADGHADIREVDCFMNNFRRNFLIPRSRAMKIINYALKRILKSEHGKLVEYSCAHINMHTNTEQRIVLLDIISEILVSDGITTDGEKFFLCYLIHKFNFTGELDNQAGLCKIGPIQKTLNSECKKDLVDGIQRFIS